MRRIWVPQAIACCMLAGALNPENPYGYYIMLRWVCCGAFAYLAFRTFAQGCRGWTWAFGVMAALYNPVLKLHLTRDMWTVVNGGTIGIALASVFAMQRVGLSGKSDAAIQQQAADGTARHR